MENLLFHMRRLLAAPVFAGDEEKTRAAGVLNTILWASISLDLLIAIVSIFDPSSAAIALAATGGFIALQAGMLLLVRRGYVQVAGWALSLSLGLAFAVLAVFTDGVRGTVLPCLVVVILIGGLVVRGYGVLVLTGLAVATEIGLFVAEMAGVLPEPLMETTPLFYALVGVVIFTLLGVGLFYAMRRLNSAVAEARRGAEALAGSNAELRARTNELEQQSRQLEAAAEAGSSAIRLRDPEGLLSQVADLIRSRFGFQRAGIFLLDETHKHAVLQAASEGEAQQPFPPGYRLNLDQEGTVSRAIAAGQTCTAPGLEAGSALPGETRPGAGWEAALPLKAGTQVIGAIDVLDDQERALGEQGLLVLQTMASQLAIAIENARLLQTIQQTVRELGSSATEILAATTQQAAGASEQAAAIAQTSTTIDEVRTIADQTAQRAQSVAAVAQRTAEVSRSGQQAVAATLTGMAEIRQKVESIATNILALSEQAQAIERIIAAVNDIAAQSNMLALNAAVEAARAGEAGRGFAIVAGEVRSLAEQSRSATVQVKEILSEIQRGVNAAVMATEEGMKGSDAGATLTTRASEAIDQLTASVQESAQAAVQIAAAAGQQLVGMEQIATAMQNIHQVTGQALTGAQQSERAAGNLNGLAGRLRQLVEQYQR
jgi:methyl-accepting chemotaxis protein